MIVLKNLLIIFISVIYALSLSYTVELKFKINEGIKKSVDLVLAMACLTSIDFMSDALEGLVWIKYLSYIMMLLIIFVTPLMINLKKRQNQSRTEGSSMSCDDEN